tara:strand:- start:9933 stop:10094 length:162 start_codon:yes stop_codon:yes gene_type:complete
MGRITKQMIDFIKKKKQKKIIKSLQKNRKEVNINNNGTHRYMIKEGKNKGTIL